MFLRTKRITEKTTLTRKSKTSTEAIQLSTPFIQPVLCTATLKTCKITNYINHI